MSISNGTYDIGIGGDYPDWSSFLADIDPNGGNTALIGNQISDITETGAMRFVSRTGSQPIQHIHLQCIDNYHNGCPTSGYKTIINIDVCSGFIFSSEMASRELFIDGLNIVASGITPQFTSLIYYAHSSYSGCIRNCIVNGNHKNIWGINSILTGTDILYDGEQDISSNLVINCSGVGIACEFGTEVNTFDSFIMNNTCYNNGIGFKLHWDDSGGGSTDSNHGYVINNSSINNSLDYYTNAPGKGISVSGWNNISSQNDPIIYNGFNNISSTDCYNNFDETSPNFLKIKANSIIANSGILSIAGIIFPSGLDLGIRKNTRPWGSGTSIGCDEWDGWEYTIPSYIVKNESYNRHQVCFIVSGLPTYTPSFLGKFLWDYQRNELVIGCSGGWNYIPISNSGLCIAPDNTVATSLGVLSGEYYRTGLGEIRMRYN